jgi:hypothetical protein
MNQTAKNSWALVAGALVIFLGVACETARDGYFFWQSQGRGFSGQELRDCRANSNFYIVATRDPRTGHWKVDPASRVSDMSCGGGAFRGSATSSSN